MDTSAVVSALNANGLAAYASLVSQLAQPGLRLTATPADQATMPIGGSHMGGEPDLPILESWPQMNGAPMSFVAQIRLSDAHGLDGGSALPADGLLSFFYDASQQTFGSDPKDRAGLSVLYTPASGIAGLARTEWPGSLAASARFKPATLTFASTATYAQDLQAEFPGRAVSPQDQQHYEAALTKLTPPPGGPRHQMLGHPDTIQDDMRQQCQFAFSGVADPSADPAKTAALAATANDWRLLLQVDSDDRLDMAWGSAGMLYFWIRQQDLASATFTNCWAVLQSD